MAIVKKYDYVIIFNDDTQKTGVVSAHSSVEAGGKVREIALRTADAHEGIAHIYVQER